MREHSRDKGRLEDIKQYGHNVETILDGITFDGFVQDIRVYYSVMKNIEVIGEAANMLTKEFREARSQTPWREIVSMRNFIVHGYNVVDKNEVWSVIQDDLVPLKMQIESYLEELTKSEEL
jgi:uncharacterized protein with HEPN domain